MSQILNTDIKIKRVSIEISIYLIVAFVIIFLSLFFILETGFIGDDAYNSQVKGSVLNAGTTIENRFYNETKGWILGAGRLIPLHWYPYFIYYATQSEVLVKTINLVVISSGVFFFGLFVKEVTSSFKVGLLCIVATPFFFQLRAWHDPILAFTFLLPLLFLYHTISFYLFQKYINENKKKYLYWSVVFHLLGLITYEAGYLFFIIFIILALYREKNIFKALKKCMIPVGINLLVIVIAILLKTKINPVFFNGYPGAELHLNFLAATKAFAIQFTSGIPLNYLLFSKSITLKEIFTNASILPIGFSIIILSYTIYAVKELVNYKILFYVGSALMILPAIIMGVSGHQKELVDVGFGYGYITVYFQYFGFSLFSLALILLLKHKFLSKVMQNTINIVCIIIFVLIGILHSAQNKFVALGTNQFYLYPRVLLKEALNSNLSKIINPKSIIVRASRYPFDNEWFFSTTLDKPMHVSDVNFFSAHENNFEVKKMTSGMSLITPKDKEVWLLSYNGNNYPHGYLYAGRLKYAYVIDANKKTGIAIIDKLFLYTDKQLTEINIENDNLIDFVKVINSQNVYNSSGTNINEIENRFLFDGVYLDWNQLYSMEGDYKNNVRWSSGEGELIIFNFSNEKKMIQLSMELAMPMQGNTNVNIKYSNSVETIDIQKQINYSKIILLPPGENRIKFSSEGKPLLNGDPRKIVFGIFNFKYSILP